MDVYEYFQTRERECREHSLVPDAGFDSMFSEEEGSHGQRGIIFGNLTLTERAFLKIWEEVVVEESGIHREAYSYYMVYDDEEKWGYDRDPDHDPAEHGHEGASHAGASRGPGQPSDRMLPNPLPTRCPAPTPRTLGLAGLL